MKQKIRRTVILLIMIATLMLGAIFATSGCENSESRNITHIEQQLGVNFPSYTTLLFFWRNANRFNPETFAILEFESEPLDLLETSGFNFRNSEEYETPLNFRVTLSGSRFHEDPEFLHPNWEEPFLFAVSGFRHIVFFPNAQIMFYRHVS